MRNLILTLFIVFIALHASANNNGANTEYFPYDTKKFLYAGYEDTLSKIFLLIEEICRIDLEQVDADIREDFKITCSFPALMQNIDATSEKIASMVGTRDLLLGPKARLIDYEYGWVAQNPFSLARNPEIPLVNLLILKELVKKSVQSMTKIWLVQGSTSSIAGRLYLLPQFAGAMERDLFFARVWEQANAIRCMNIGGEHGNIETGCFRKKFALIDVINVIKEEYKINATLPSIEYSDFITASSEFRSQLQTFLKENPSVLKTQDMLLDPNEDLIELYLSYRKLMRIPKEITSESVSQQMRKYFLRKQFVSYPQIKKETLEKDVEIDNALSTDIIEIYENIKKQLDLLTIKEVL